MVTSLLRGPRLTPVARCIVPIATLLLLAGAARAAIRRPAEILITPLVHAYIEAVDRLTASTLSRAQIRSELLTVVHAGTMAERMRKWIGAAERGDVEAAARIAVWNGMITRSDPAVSETEAGARAMIDALSVYAAHTTERLPERYPQIVDQLAAQRSDTEIIPSAGQILLEQGDPIGVSVVCEEMFLRIVKTSSSPSPVPRRPTATPGAMPSAAASR